MSDNLGYGTTTTTTGSTGGVNYSHQEGVVENDYKQFYPADEENPSVDHNHNDIVPDEETQQPEELKQTTSDLVTEWTHVIAFFCCFPIFSSYACFISLQDRIRKAIHIEGKSDDAQTFSFAVSCFFYTILMIRIGHNFLFAFLRPRGRVYFGYLGCATALSLLTILVFVYDKQASSSKLWCIFLCYTIGALSVGSFEAVYVSSITPLGPRVKRFAIAGMPSGYSGCSILAFIFFSLRPNDEAFTYYVLVTVAILNLIAAVVFFFCIPDVRYEASEMHLQEAIDGLKEWRNWVIPLLPSYTAMFLNMFCVILLSGAPQLMYNFPEVPLFAFDWSPHNITMTTNSTATTVPPSLLSSASSSSSSLFLMMNQNTTTTIIAAKPPKPYLEKDSFLAIYFVFDWFGDFVSRFVGYKIKDLNRCGIFSPLCYVLIFSIPGALLMMSTWPLGAWIGVFLVLFANGTLYSTTLRVLDANAGKINRKYNLLAFSIFLLMGDAGSSVASTLTHDFVEAIVGRG